MKIQIVSVLALSLLTSCAVMNKIMKKDNSSAGQQVEPVVEVTDASADSLFPSNNKVSTMPIKKELIKLDSLSLMKINGLWTLRSINGKTLSVNNGDDESNRPYVNFDSRSGKFYANDGCNTINGSFIAKQGDLLTIDPLLSTMMLCPDAPYEAIFKTGLAETTSFKKEQRDNESILTLLNGDGKTIMTLARPSTEFLNGAWQVVAIDDKKIANDNVKIVIDLPEEKVHGNTGCNVFNGSIFVDPDKGGSIQFQQIGVTRMLCPDMTTETAFLVALESVEYARQEGENAILLDGNHKKVLTLVPLELK